VKSPFKRRFPGFGGTGFTPAVQQYIMLFQGITPGQQPFYIVRASMDFKQFITGAAEEMVVVAGRGHFPAGRLAGQFHPVDFVFRLKSFKAAVNGSDAQPVCLSLSQLEYFIDRERPPCLAQRFINGFPLLCCLHSTARLSTDN
jgi:hypothetical protein